MILRVILETGLNLCIPSAFDRNDIRRKQTHNYLFTSRNKFQDSNCIWLSGSMNNEYALQLPQNYTWSTKKWMGMNGWPIHQNAKCAYSSWAPLQFKVWPPSHPYCRRCSVLGTIRGSPHTRPNPQLHPNYDWLGVSSAAEVPGNWPAS